MKPTIGRIVLYRLTGDDFLRVAGRRNREGIAGTPVNAGDQVPMIVTKVAEHGGELWVNGKALLDGEDTLWIKGVAQGDLGGTWQWPTIAAPAAPIGVAYGDRI